MEDRAIVANDEQITPQRSSDSQNHTSFGCVVVEPKLERSSHQAPFRKEVVNATKPVALPADTNNANSTSLPATSTINSAPAPPSPLSSSGEQNEIDPDITSNVLEIVRHIACFLSLSDVGSIAALYSSFAHIGRGVDSTEHNLPPPMHTSRVAWSDGAGGGDSETSRIIDPSRQRHHSKPETSRGTVRPIRFTPTTLDQSHNVFCGDTYRGGSNKDVAMSTIIKEGVKKRDSFFLGSGPDECAGLGISQPIANVTTTDTTSTTIRENKKEQKATASSAAEKLANSKATLSQLISSTIHKRVYSKFVHSIMTNSVATTSRSEADASASASKKNSSLMSTPPALIALSPDVTNDDEYYNYYDNELEEIDEVTQRGINDNDKNKEEDDSESSQHCDCNIYSSSGQGDEIHTHKSINEQILENQAEQIRLEHIQQRLCNIVLNHPQSIRSYSQSCSLKQEQKLQPKNQQRRKQGFRQRECDWSWKREEDKYSPTPQMPSSVCASCHLLTGMRRDTHQEKHSLFRHGGNSPAVLSVTEDDDAVAEEDTEEEIDDYLNHVTASCCCSEEQRRHYSYQLHQQTAPPPPYSRILRLFTDPIFQNVPLSIIFDASSLSLHTLLKTFESGLTLADTSIQSIIKILIYSIHASCASLASTLHPKRLLEFVIHLHQYAMKTYKMISSGGGGNEGGVVSHAVSSVTNSVVGSYVGTVAMVQSLYRNSSGNSSSSYGGDDGLSSCVADDSCRRFSSDIGGDSIRDDGMIERVIPEKMFRKINRVEYAAKVISYVERRDDALITPHDRKKLYYPVSLRPFIATIEVAAPVQKHSFRNVDFPLSSYHQKSEADGDYGHEEYSYMDDSYSESSYESTAVGDDDEADSITSASPFMYTPKSFPPTPSSRAHVLARGTRFAEDVIFLARDQLRIKKGLESSNDKTRAMAKALLDGSRLAIFNAVDVSCGVALTCGQHCASKVGSDLYCSARGMIPMLRNCFVYFEMSVSTPPLLSMMLHHASLSVGLSTLEMPLNALVGAWEGSTGLCSTGQMLAGSLWCLPLVPRTYGSSSVVGCLVYLDDESAFYTLDGVMVPASVVFNVNGQVVTPTGALCSDNVEDDSREGNTRIRNQGDNVNTTSSISLLVPRGEELFPTITLHSSQTEVVCRFCSADIVAKSREEIGLPMNETVYAVDGSVIFDEE